jgi:hypothetical protein
VIRDHYEVAMKKNPLGFPISSKENYPCKDEEILSDKILTTRGTITSLLPVGSGRRPDPQPLSPEKRGPHVSDWL